MFKVCCHGQVIKEPTYSIVDSREVCNFTLLVKDVVRNKLRKSSIRCTAYDENVNYIRSCWEKGKTVIVCGDGINCPFDTKYYRFNLLVSTITII